MIFDLRYLCCSNADSSSWSWPSEKAVLMIYKDVIQLEICGSSSFESIVNMAFHLEEKEFFIFHETPTLLFLVSCSRPPLSSGPSSPPPCTPPSPWWSQWSPSSPCQPRRPPPSTPALARPSSPPPPAGTRAVAPRASPYWENVSVCRESREFVLYGLTCLESLLFPAGGQSIV